MSATATSQGLSGVDLDVESVRASERLNGPFELEVRFFVEADTDVAPALGKDFVLELTRDSSIRRFVGVVTEVLQGDREATGSLLHGVRVVPALALLQYEKNTRIFQDKTVLDIVQEVLEQRLSPFNRTVSVSAAETYPTREYCLQYRESDLDFVHRLLEEEGLGYFFKHDGETEELVLTDDNAQFQDVVTLPGDTNVPYHDDRDRSIENAEPIHRFQRGLHTTVTQVAVRDYDFTGQATDAEEAGEDELGKVREVYEHGLGRSLTIGDYSGSAYGANDAARQALIRRQMHLAGGTIARGLGRVVSFAPGVRFDLVDHPSVGNDGSYLLTEVSHTWSSAGGSGDPYRNRFVCIPGDTPYRPARRTPKPSVDGPETAIVTGPSGEEIFTDAHGRIKVHFHWDRLGASDDHSSCFLRVRQPWAGEGWGFNFIPRIGMEVVVDFVAGDPDRPLVDGCVYNGDHAAPYTLPDDKTKSTIKSQSSPGKPAGFNELRFEDKAGKEEVFTHAEKDQNELVKNYHSTWVGGDQENIVGATQTQKIHENQTEYVIGNQTMTVGTDRTVYVKGAFTETIAQGELCEIDSGVTEIIKPSETRDVSGSFLDDITDGELKLVGGGVKEAITGTHDQHVLGPNTEVMLSGSTQTITAGPVTFKTAGVHKLKSGGPIAFVGTAGITEESVVWEEVTDIDVDFKPIDEKHKGADTKSSGNTVGVYKKKKGAVGASAAAGVLAAEVVKSTAGLIGVKMSLAGVKVDVYGHKEEPTITVKFAPFTIEVT